MQLLLKLIFLLLFISTDRVYADHPAMISDLNNVVSNFLGISIPLVGGISAIMLVVGGFKFLTAGGDKEATAKAGHTITYSVIGLVVTASAWLIVSFIGGFLGIDLGTFNITVNNGSL